MDISRYWKPVVNTLTEGLLIVDARGNILDANTAAESITGYRADELLGQSCRILNCTGCNIFDPGKSNCFCSLFEEGEIRNKRCQITHKDRRIIEVQKSATILRDHKGEVIGAAETLTDMSEIVRDESEILALRKSFHLDEGFHGIIGETEPMRHLYELIENVSQTDAPVLIHGESGSGKELVARAIHDSGNRKGKPFIKVNCAALNENLLESELFGHIKGAFTGAYQTRVGRFEAAHEGTIFLDEIGDIPPATQVKLLRVLEEKKIERVGDYQPVSVDVRIITATNKNIEKLIQQGLFREDLYFRINVFPLRCPSLAERHDDIPFIISNFIKDNNMKTGKKISGVAPDAMKRLMNYDWPGNVRELRNAIEFAFVLCTDNQIQMDHLPPKIASSEKTKTREHYDQKTRQFEAERKEFIRVLNRAGGNQTEMAKLLGVSRVTVWKRMKKYNIDPKSINGRNNAL